jgi:hypothetical protein
MQIRLPTAQGAQHSIFGGNRQIPWVGLLHSATAQRRIVAWLSPPRCHQRGCDLGPRYLPAQRTAQPDGASSLGLFSPSSRVRVGEAFLAPARASSVGATTRFHSGGLSGCDLFRDTHREQPPLGVRSVKHLPSMGASPKRSAMRGAFAGFLSRHSRPPCFMQPARAGFDRSSSSYAPEGTPDVSTGAAMPRALLLPYTAEGGPGGPPLPR